jgi:hypothetical protein
MTTARKARLAAAIDRERLELQRCVHGPEDLGAARTIALSRRLDNLIFRYLSLPAPPARRT